MSTYNQLIPDELLWKIVEHVDNLRTLYSLLTISTRVFKPAVEKLWKAPFGFSFENQGGMRRLLDQILTMSSSQHPAVENLRMLYGISPSQGTAPYVDYLGMIRHVRSPSNSFDHSMFDHDMSPPSVETILRALPWIVCNSQFDQLSTIVITPSNAEEYIDVIPSMTRLKMVVCAMLAVKEDSIPPILKFVETFVVAHGERGRQLQICFNGTGRHIDMEIHNFASEFVEMFKLLAPFPPRMTVVERTDDWLRCAAHKDNTDFSNLREIRTNSDFEVDSILPKCHRLEKLGLGYISGFPAILKAFSELRPLDDSHSTKTFSKVPAQLPVRPPLCFLQIRVPGYDLPPLMNGLASCFGTTLEDIDVYYFTAGHFFSPYRTLYVNDSENFTALEGNNFIAHLRSSRWNFSSLRNLSINRLGSSSFYIHIHGDMSGLPKLETLCLRGTIQWKPKNVGQFDMCEVWRLPELRKLVLTESMAYKFNLWSLAHSPKLENLELALSEWVADMGLLLHPSELRNDITPSNLAACPTLLKQVVLIDHASLYFGLGTVCRFMPTVEGLKLKCGNYEPLDQFFDGQVGTRAEHSSKAIPSIHLNTLKTLEICDTWLQTSVWFPQGLNEP